jgi:diguanylate cyclase (GGDEF)-like protein
MKNSRSGNRLHHIFIIAISILLLILVAYIDYITGIDISLAIFYLIPIFITTWAMGNRAGILMALAGSVAFYLVDRLVEQSPGNMLVYYWNVVVISGFYFIFAYLLSKIKIILKREKELARTDDITQVANGRAFFEIINQEIMRAHRYSRPFAVAYLDLDNFKAINDQFGHSVGNILLHTAAQAIQNQLRSTDIVARLGGDEFAILLPETGSDSAPIIIERIHGCLIEALRRNQWDTTVSIGVAIFNKPPASADAAIALADSLMYAIKGTSKNRIKYETY